jgi:transcriptional regulator with XRE-family HTH domain
MSRKNHPNSKYQKETLSRIGERVEQIALENNYSLSALAAKAGINPQTIYNIRSGKSLPRADTLLKLKIVVKDLDINWLITGEKKYKELKLGTNFLNNKLEQLTNENDELKDKINQVIALLKQ